LIDEAEALLASGGSAAKPDTASSQHWVLAMDAEPKPHNLFCWLEVPQLTAARVLIGKGAPAPLGRALELLAAVRKLGAESRFRCQLIEVAVLEAVALERQGKPDGAAAALDEALALARPGGWLRPFLESGAPLRGHLARLGKKGTEDGFLDVILRRLGPEGPNATRQPQTAANTSEPPVRIDSPHIELLSNREHDIIELLADRLRSKEIADRLFISTHTVNAHLKRIYRKLGVSNRREAVERAVRARLIERR
jgi:LuxR family maltose regulon positive regulatory protein